MIKVLIVDDSSFMRKSLRHILESENVINVVGTAADGEEAIRKVKKLHPQVVLLDIEMPVMDGLTALAHIMTECPTPVLMLSALNKRSSSIAVKSLSHGAVDFIAKPSGVISYDIDRLGSEIVKKVKMAAIVNVNKMDFLLPDKQYQRHCSGPSTQEKIVIIGASTGGPRGVTMVLSALPRDITAAIIVVQHMAPEFVPSFVESLQWRCSLNISTAEKGRVIGAGQVLVAPGGYNTMIFQNGYAKKIRLNKQTSVNAAFSSVDCAMESAAKTYGKDTLGVLLSGMGSDGAKGMKAIKDAGGRTIAEDQSTCIVFGMPKAAIDMGCVDEVVPLPKIAPAILKMISGLTIEK